MNGRSDEWLRRQEGKLLILNRSLIARLIRVTPELLIFDVDGREWAVDRARPLMLESVAGNSA